LLDTNVVSEIGRPKPSAAVVGFVSSQPIEALFSSTIVLAELRHGIELLADPERRLLYSDWLERTIRPMFGSRVLHVTEDSMLRWLLLVRDARRRGRTFPEPDLLLGSVALQNGMTLVTRNTRDFEDSGVMVFNPWSA
jgi:toxin FitB